MFMIMYTTGNGYRCSCCRHTNSSFYDADDEADAIAECVRLSRAAEGDFHLNEIRGYEGDAEDLEKKITEAIEASERTDSEQKALAELKSEIKKLERWQETLPQEIERNAKRLVELKKKLGAS